MAQVDCETCLLLWAEYAWACRIRDEIRTPKMILAAIEDHEADHQESETIPERKTGTR
jgi:hypothetical protein